MARGVLFDLDGTLYEAGRLIPGTLETLQYCETKGMPYRFVTNITSKSRRQIAGLMRDLGINVPEEWIFTAPVTASRLLHQQGRKRCYFLLREELLEDFSEVESVHESPDAVVVGDIGENLNYRDMNRAFRFLLEKECGFLTLARNRFFKVSDGLSIDVGAFVAALEYATDRTAELVGKPSKSFFHTAVESMGLNPQEVAMIGDDLESDALGAMHAGLIGILVKTGKFRESMLAQSSEQPDAVWNSIGELPKSL